MKKIDIIIPAYNAAQTINKCIDSLLDQTIQQDYQIIVINDGSRDETLKKLAKYSDNDKVKIVNKANTGASNTRNKGIELADSKYITFVDADDYVNEDYLESLYTQYEQSSCDLAITGYVKEDNNGEIRFNGLGHQQMMDRPTALHDIFISMGFEGYLWNKLFRLSLIKQNNLFFDNSIKIAEDLLFCCKYLTFCRKVSLNPKVTYHYVVNQNSQINSKKYGNNFSVDSLDVIEVYKQIKKLIQPLHYDDVVAAINSQLCWSATTILRVIYLAPNKDEVSPDIIKRLRKIQKKYQNIFLKNDILPQRDRTIYLLNRYCPSMFAFMWKQLKLRGNGY